MKKYFIIFATLILAACGILDDKYKRPETPVPPAWKNGDSSSGTLPDAEWWKGFNSQRLTSLIEESLAANYDIKVAIAQVREADAQAKIAGAPLLPSLGANAGVSRQRQPSALKTVVVSSNNNSARSNIFNTYSTGLNASYEVDFWGKNWAAAENALATAEQNRFNQETVKLTVTSGVATTYFAILGTEDRLAAAKNNLKAANELLQAYRDRFAQGIANDLDVAQQESLVAAQAAAIPPLELQIKQSSDALAILLGKNPEALDIPQSGLKELTAPAVSPGMPSELLQRRPDVARAEAALIAANANINSARDAFFPAITLTGQRGYESPQLSQLFTPQSILWNIAAGLTQPIFEGGAIEGGWDLTKARYEEMLQDYHKAVVSAFSDTEDALVAVQQDAEEEKAETESVRVSQKAYDLTLLQFKQGIIDITTVLNTQRALFTAQDALVQAKLAHLQAIVQLYNALGGGWKGEAQVPSVLKQLPKQAF